MVLVLGLNDSHNDIEPAKHNASMLCKVNCFVVIRKKMSLTEERATFTTGPLYESTNAMAIPLRAPSVASMYSVCGTFT